MIAAIAAITILFGCNNTTTRKKPVLAVSIQPQKYLLEKIVGEKYTVTCLLAQGANPENYEPNAAHLMNLESCQAFFRIGHIGFELAISNRIKSNNPDLKVFDTSEGLTLIEGSHYVGHVDKHNHEIDPHVWSSVRNVMRISQNMYNDIVELDPKNKLYYYNRFNKLASELMSLDSKIVQILDSAECKSFLVWHPSLSYFARDYGLKQISLETEGKESSIKGFKQRLDKAAADSVSVFLYQQEFDSRQAEAIGKELGVRIENINPMNYDWENEMLSTARAIAGK